jgi:hypothetical protein
MKQIHVECDPDELLVSKLGFTRKFVTHHQGKSRVFHALGKLKHQLAVVDEDPGSARAPFEKTLEYVEEFEGIKYFTDRSGNKIFILKGKLEDWIIYVCKQYKIKLSAFGLPDKPDDLHEVINQKLANFGKLIDEMIEHKNPAILKLKAWLN